MHMHAANPSSSKLPELMPLAPGTSSGSNSRSSRSRLLNHWSDLCHHSLGALSAWDFRFFSLVLRHPESELERHHIALVLVDVFAQASTQSVLRHSRTRQEMHARLAQYTCSVAKAAGALVFNPLDIVLASIATCDMILQLLDLILQLAELP